MKTNRWIGILLIVITSGSLTRAQSISVAAGTDLTLAAGTVFTVDGITFLPTNNYILNGITLSRTTTIAHPAATGTHISRVYQFSDVTPPFTGTIQINYQPSELNGLTESLLLLNVHDGNSWQALTSTTNDAINHYVLTTLSDKSLNELTLTSITTVLPLTWLAFTATPQNSQAFLQWSTASEQNTRDYLIQHSISGDNWQTIGTAVPAAGNSKVVQNYHYTHTNPVNGTNYYRIQQVDLDGQYSFSEIKSVLFSTNVAGFAVVTNPVTNGVLKVQVHAATDLFFYNANGILLWKKHFGTGVQHIAVSSYSQGIYYMSDGKHTRKVVVL